MKLNLTLLIAIMLLASLAIAELPKPGALPSDEIQYTDPPKAISLQNVDRMSAWAIAMSNAPLAKQPRWSMADIGYMTSESQAVAQEAGAGVTDALRNFTQSIPELPESIGNVSENVTVINDTIVWW